MPKIFGQNECKNSELLILTIKDQIKISGFIHHLENINLHFIAHDENAVQYGVYLERNLLMINILKKILARQKITLSEQTRLSLLSDLKGTIVFKKSVLLDSEKNSRCVIL